ncbi:hypothetical protein OA57_04170 [Chelonobacter oris]|uniref:HTH lysR-type domain-containing protein n=1 Tax=Chelonobacter oris TaxID=505317 RepID=A0A0A3BBH5_9PAST|nr:LysR family transcriptional regulator [Chelonobacter oris]KGQ70904.1 hypothetical protein OA57_04170 [Chelonobacter oris]
MINLRQLVYFTKVAELGSYTRAADELNVAQPLLSRQIRQLEVKLHRHLLIRHGRGVKTTEAGNLLLKHCYTILGQIEALKEDMSLSNGKITGTISLGVPPTLSKLFARDIIKTFCRRLPDANLIVTEGLTSNLQERLQLGRLNIALLHNPSFVAELDYELLINVHLMLITRRDDPLLDDKTSINANDLETIPLIIPSENNTFRQLLDSEMAKRHKKPNIVLEVDSKELILDLVMDGMGHSILLPMVLALGQTNRQLTALPITDPVLPCHLYMATSNKLSPSRLELALIAIIQEVCKKYFPDDYPLKTTKTAC